jgi:hypothetical protein
MRVRLWHFWDTDWGYLVGKTQYANAFKNNTSFWLRKNEVTAISGSYSVARGKETVFDVPDEIAKQYSLEPYNAQRY